LAHLHLDGVAVAFPLLHDSAFSLKKTLLFRLGLLSTAKPRPPRRWIQALSDVTISFNHGDRVGLIGANGAGKSTLLKVLAGIYEPTAGSIDIHGHVCPLFDVNLGMNPETTGYENIELRALHLGLKLAEIRRNISEIADFTELGDFLSMPVRTYSTGMAFRLAFAITTFLRPDILLMDEMILAGDAGFQAKASARLRALIDNSGILVLASHSDDLLRQWCNKGLVMAGGRVQFFGPIDAALAAYHLSLNPVCDAPAIASEKQEGYAPAH
jgi:ABC-2 type transport system ATP-binding protein/lipopolysaccharide transport system ATP-binding protein